MPSYSDHSHGSNGSPLSASEGKRNNRTRALTALLSATALGFFLEGCKGSSADGASGNNSGEVPPPTPPPPPPPPPPTLVEVVGTLPLLATANAEAFVGDEEENTISYETSNVVVIVDLQDPVNNRGSFAQADTYDNIENIQGSSEGDSLTGDSQDNNLDGGAGNDRLIGGEGADTLIGGAGDDRLIGGEGADTLIGGAGEDQLEGGAGEDKLIGGAGDDGLAGGADMDTYLFGAGDGKDNVKDDSGNMIFLQGTNNNDYTDATYSFERGDEGSGEAVALMISKDGNMLNILEFANDPSSGFTFYTRNNNDIDTIIPPSSLVVPPRLGSETNPFVATAEVDIFPGSTDYDWASYVNSAAGVRIALGESSSLVTTLATVSEGWAIGDMLTNINNLIGSDHRDILRGNSDANSLYGGGGIDSLFGGAGADHLYGGADIDLLIGGAGADTLDGGGGRNYASYLLSEKGVRIDLSLTGAQQDFEANSFGFIANANEAVGDIFINIQNVRGSASNDWFSGDDGNNEFYSREGNDRISGGAGDDYLSGDAGADFLDGGLDTDTAGYRSATRGVRVNLLLQGQQQQDFTVAHGFSPNNNDALGDTLSNIENITGSPRDDWLTGNHSSNRIIGDRGNDRLEGGEGSDTYAFDANDGTDTVIDNGGNIVFEQRAGNNYVGATYSFTRATNGGGEAVTLTVTKDGIVLNVIEFASDPSSDYNFYTRIGTTNTEIPATLLVVPARRGSESQPFLATDTADIFEGSVDAGIDYDWVSYASSTSAVTINLDDEPATVAGGWASGDTLRGINNLLGSDLSGAGDELTGNGNPNILRGLAGDDTLAGGAGNDILDGGAGTDIYLFKAGDGVDTISDELEAIASTASAVLRFQGSDYDQTDFASASVTTGFKRDGNNLVLSLDADDDGGLDNVITILNAYYEQPGSGVAGTNVAFTLTIEYSNDGVSFNSLADSLCYGIV